MSRLLGLYPRAWRDRYGLEFQALMEARAPSLRDRIDIVLGAADARLHPQVRAAPDERWQPSKGARLTGVSVILAGLGWLAWLGLILRDFRGWGAGMPPNADLMVLLAFAGFLVLAIATAAIAATFQRWMDPLGMLGAVLAVPGFGFTAFGGGMSIVVAFLGIAVLAWAMAGRAIPAWLSVAWIGATLLAAVAMIAFVAGNGRDVGLLALGLPFGVAFLIVGMVIVGRRTDLLPSGR
jgi:hypothetical protein